MLPRTKNESFFPALSNELVNWRLAYKDSFKSISDLTDQINFSDEEKKVLKNVTALYHMRIPKYYFSLIKDLNDPNDPVSRQCLPCKEELSDHKEERMDPLSEVKTSPLPWLVHRYPDRVLLLVSSRCFMYCRHCTRKRLWKNKIQEPSLREIDASLRYVKENPNIREVIISGGDPLILSSERLDCIISKVNQIPTIESIRIGTRAPVVFPQRIDKSLCMMLERYNKLWINVQFNHPQEITKESTEAIRKLQKCGIPVSNQSVLLKGINDNPKVMLELCRKLQSIRVRPYYLFQCDPVIGATHFRTPVLKGVEILKKMRGYTAGMCVPLFVVDGIDGNGKVPLIPNNLVSVTKKGLVLKNYKNEQFFYENPPE